LESQLQAEKMDEKYDVIVLGTGLKVKQIGQGEARWAGE
jgi:RAB protein geranylgeranyltransferase component A